MKQILVLSIIILLANISNAQFEFRGGQHYSYDENITLYLEADMQSRKLPKDSFIYRLLKVYEDTEHGVSEIMRMELHKDAYNKSYDFGDVCDLSLRKLVIIQGFDDFYIYDIKGREISQLLKPKFWGVEETPENRKIQSIKISENGKYLYGINTGSGAFLYDICDLKNPKEIISLNLPFFSKSRVFEIKNCKKDTYTGVYITQIDNKIIIKELFNDKNLVPQTNFEMLNFSEDKIEEIIMTTPISVSRYAIFKEITSKPNKYIVVDVIKGKIVEISNGKYFSDKLELLEYLSK